MRISGGHLFARKSSTLFLQPLLLVKKSVKQVLSPFSSCAGKISWSIG